MISILPRHTEKRTLVGRYQAADRESAEELLQANEALVRHLAGKAVPFAHGMEFEDLCQEGRLALLHAATLFDAARGLQFSTYAALAIQRALRRSIESQGHLIYIPGHVVWREDLPRCDLSLDASIGEEGDATFGDLLPGGINPEHTVVAAIWLEDLLAKLLAKLPPFERRIIELRAEGLTLRQVADRLQIGREKARRMEVAARARVQAWARTSAREG